MHRVRAIVIAFVVACPLYAQPNALRLAVTSPDQIPPNLATARLEWLSGDVVLFTESNAGINTCPGSDVIELTVNANGDAAVFAAIYENPATSVLTAPQLSIRLSQVDRRGDASVLTHVPYAREASALWAKHSEDTVGLQAQIDDLRATVGDSDADTLDGLDSTAFVLGSRTATIIAGTGLSGGITADALGDGFTATLVNTGDINPADDITSITAGGGISATGSGNSRTVSVVFGGNGTSASVARADHTHPPTPPPPAAPLLRVDDSEDSTPFVAGAAVLLLDYSGASVTITDLDGGVDGQCVAIITTSGTPQINDVGNFHLSSNWTPNASDSLTVCRAAGQWYETARSSN